MKRSVRSLCRIAALFLLVCLLGGCSGGLLPPGSESVKGSVQSWGNISVFIPEGMTLTGGSVADHNDPNALWIQLDENQMHYFLVSIVSEESALSGVETTKEMNSGAKDVSVEIGGVTWTGVSYQFAGVTDCFQLWAPIDGKIALVQSAGFACEGAQTKAILSSLKLS